MHPYIELTDGATYVQLSSSTCIRRLIASGPSVRACVFSSGSILAVQSRTLSRGLAGHSALTNSNKPANTRAKTLIKDRSYHSDIS